MESGISADVHIFSADEGDWVLLLDATLYESQRSLVQQKGNDLSLIRNKQAKSLHQHFNYPGVEISPGFLHLLERGVCTDVTILLAHICEFTSFVETNSPEEVFITLNSYISAMIQSVLDEGGMVDKITGDTVMTLFGVLPATEVASVHGVNAAIRMIEAVKEVSKVRQEKEYSTFDTGIGIASGSVLLGTISGSKNNKTFIAVGDYVNLAEKLGLQARPREILIDENTFNSLGKQNYCSMFTVVETKIVEPVRIYSYLVT